VLQQFAIGAQLRADSGVQCLWCVAVVCRSGVCCSSVMQQFAIGTQLRANSGCSVSGVLQ